MAKKITVKLTPDEAVFVYMHRYFTAIEERKFILASMDEGEDKENALTNNAFSVMVAHNDLNQFTWSMK